MYHKQDSADTNEFAMDRNLPSVSRNEIASALFLVRHPFTPSSDNFFYADADA